MGAADVIAKGQHVDITFKVFEPGDALSDELWITFTSPDPLPDWPTLRELVIARTGRDLSNVIIGYEPTWTGPGQPFEETWAVRRAA